MTEDEIKMVNEYEGSDTSEDEDIRSVEEIIESFTLIQDKLARYAKKSGDVTPMLKHQYCANVLREMRHEIESVGD